MCLLASNLSLLASPENDAWFELAETSLLEKDYELVIELTDQLLSGPEIARYSDARFLRAMANQSLGKTEATIEDLTIYLQGDGAYLEEASGLLEAVVASAEEEANAGETAGSSSTPKGIFDGHRFQYSLSFGGQYDSRVLIRPGGPNDDIPADDPEIEDVAAKVSAVAQYYDPVGGPFIRYVGDFTGYADAETERRLLNTGYLGWHTTFGGSPYDLEIAGFGESILLDWENFRTRLGGHIGLSHSPGTRRDWILFEVGQDDYPDYDDFSGDYVTVLGGQTFFRLPWTFGWSASHLQQTANLNVLDYSETTLSGSASYDLNEDITLGGTLIYADNPYKRFDPVFDQVREDTYWTSRLWLKYKLTDDWSLQPSVTYINRSSSVDRLEYDRVLFEINSVLLHW